MNPLAPSANQTLRHVWGQRGFFSCVLYSGALKLNCIQNHVLKQAGIFFFAFIFGSTNLVVSLCVFVGEKVKKRPIEKVGIFAVEQSLGPPHTIRVSGGASSAVAWKETIHTQQY